MIITSETAEERAVMNSAYAICAAARTTPKARGIDNIDTAVLTGEDKNRISEEMRRICEHGEDTPMFRDAENVDRSDVVVLIGVKNGRRLLGSLCQLCHFENCEACEEAGACCVFDLIDLGIAIGSAVSKAADMRVDNRVMFTVGKAASNLGILGDYRTIMGIPLSVSGKSPYFDRG